jgi:single-strand DNA-binding protein
MDLNKAMLIGNVGRDPEYHDMQSGGQLCKFSIATTRKWKNKNSGEMNEQTTWHNIVIFNKYLVTFCKQFVQKGSRVYIEGEISSRNYDKDGVKHWITEITIPQVKGDLILLGKGKDSDDGSPRHPADQTSDQFRKELGPNYGKDPDEYDDDIPF